MVAHQERCNVLFFRYGKCLNSSDGGGNSCVPVYLVMVLVVTAGAVVVAVVGDQRWW